MNRSYSKIRHIQEANKRLEKRFLTEESTIDEQTVLGTIGNAVEIGGKVLKNLFKRLPGHRMRALKKAAKDAAERGDTTPFQQMLDQVLADHKAELKGDAEQLKNAMMKGDVAKNVKGLAQLLNKMTAPLTAPFKKGMGNQQQTAQPNTSTPQPSNPQVQQSTSNVKSPYTFANKFDTNDPKYDYLKNQ